jgi:hypothetical protein
MYGQLTKVGWLRNAARFRVVDSPVASSYYRFIPYVREVDRSRAGLEVRSAEVWVGNGHAGPVY